MYPQITSTWKEPYDITTLHSLFSVCNPYAGLSLEAGYRWSSRFRAQSAFKIFDSVAVPPKSDQSFSENGDKEISSSSDSAQIL